MNGFFKSLLHRMNKNTEIVKIFPKQLRRKQRKYTTRDIKKAWNIMKDITEKLKIKLTNLPPKLNLFFYWWLFTHPI